MNAYCHDDITTSSMHW